MASSQGTRRVDTRQWTIRAHHAFDPVVTVERGFDSLAWGERVEVVAASERDRLRVENERLREDLGVVVYHAENLQRYIDHKPVRDLAESRMAFENAKRGLEIDEQRPCHHERLVQAGPAGRFCGECGEPVEVTSPRTQETTEEG